MPVFAAKTYAEWEAPLAGTGIPFGVIGRLADVVDDEQADARRHLRRDDQPRGAAHRQQPDPARVSLSRARSGPPSAVGQHSRGDPARGRASAAAEIEALKKSGALG